MTDAPVDATLDDHPSDGVDRRGFLSCMAWAGTGALWLMKGGVLESYSLSHLVGLSHKDLRADLSFIQISDSHMGFNKPANTTSSERSRRRSIASTRSPRSQP